MSFDIKKEIQDVYELTDPKAFEPGTPTFFILTTWVYEISEAIQAVAEKLSGEDRQEVVDACTEVALWLWDEIVVPEDIPRIPEFFEKRIEESVRTLIPALVESAIDKAFPNE